MWGGDITYTSDKQPDIINALVQFGHDVSQDTKAALIIELVYTSGQEICIASLEYSDPVAVSPPIFENFKNITALSDATKIQSLSNITLEFKAESPDGLRETFWTATFKLDTDFVTYLTNLFFSGIDPIKSAVGVVPVLDLQVIPTSEIEQMQKNGGNALGLDPSDGPLILFHLICMWESPEDDDAIYSALGAIIKEAIAEAQNRGMFNEYHYMNYASQFQDVIASYGAENRERLLEISRKYDPHHVFEKLQPGFFKLKGAPDPNYPAV